jgi:hypothetical protein
MRLLSFFYCGIFELACPQNANQYTMNPYLKGRNTPDCTAQFLKGQKLQKIKVHESVLVGYFCQAVGWVARDLDVQRYPSDTPQQRMLRAINLSHNPLDPAIGDMILQIDNSVGLPKEFYVFEFKVDWKKGIGDEHEKFRVKNKGVELTPESVDYIFRRFPEAKHAHLFGALLPTSAGKNALCAHSYWDSLLGNHGHQVPGILSALHAIATGASGKGMSLERLVKYVSAINSEAAEGSKASTGSARFAVAYDDYQLYSFNLDNLIEYQLEKQRTLERHRQLEVEKKLSREDGPSLGR